MAKKAFWTTLGVVSIVGGAAHALQGFLNYNLLSMFGDYALIVQGIAGVATIVFVGKKFK